MTTTVWFLIGLGVGLPIGFLILAMFQMLPHEDGI